MDSKDLIKQYVNTGSLIPEYQVNKLSSNDLNSYLRTRFISFNPEYFSSSNEIKAYEYRLMTDEMKDSLVSKVHRRNLDDMLTAINGRGKSDDFIMRVLKLRTSGEVKENLSYILMNAHSPVSVINEMLDMYGEIFTSSGSISTLSKYFHTDEGKVQFYRKLINRINTVLGDRIMNTDNTPILGMLHNLDDEYSASLSRYIMMLNLKKPHGNIIDRETFYTIMNNLSDRTFTTMGTFLKKNFELMPKQIQYIDNLG